MATCEVCHAWFPVRNGGCDRDHHVEDGYNQGAWCNLSFLLEMPVEKWQEAAAKHGIHPGDENTWQKKYQRM
jgi:hypothetical protein